MIVAILISILVAVAMFGLIVGLFSSLGTDADHQNQRMSEIKSGDVEREKAPKEKVKLSQNIKNKIEENNKKREKNKRKKAQQKKKANVVEDMLTMVQINMTSEEFAAIKLVVACIFMFLAFILCRNFRLDTTYLLIFIVIAGLLGMILPSEWLKKKAAKYQESIRLELPEVMDLLVVSVEAGLGFDAALTRLYEKNKSILMEELMQATRDIQRGVSKKEAYNDLSKRCKVKELTSFLSAMVQADQMGSSIKSVLKAQAETLRAERGRRAAKKAKEAPVKMLIPMVLLIFPVIFIILLGPAFLNIMEILG